MLLDKVFIFSRTPFVQWGVAHLTALALIVTLGALCWRLRAVNAAQRKWLRATFALILLLNEAAWHVWHVQHGFWDFRTMLPLNLCNLMVLLAAWELLTLQAAPYPFLYFLGIGGAAQVLITPALGPYGFPHPLFFQIFISHGGVVLAAVYLAVVERLSPQGWRDFWRVFVGMNLYLLLMFFVNRWLGANYLFIMFKPPVPTLLDHLGPWPWYILSMEAIGTVLAGLLYLPFFLRGKA